MEFKLLGISFAHTTTMLRYSFKERWLDGFKVLTSDDGWWSIDSRDLCYNNINKYSFQRHKFRCSPNMERKSRGFDTIYPNNRRKCSLACCYANDTDTCFRTPPPHPFPHSLRDSELWVGDLFIYHIAHRRHPHWLYFSSKYFAMATQKLKTRQSRATFQRTLIFCNVTFFVETLQVKFLAGIQLRFQNV